MGIVFPNITHTHPCMPTHPPSGHCSADWRGWSGDAPRRRLQQQEHSIAELTWVTRSLQLHMWQSVRVSSTLPLNGRPAGMLKGPQASCMRQGGVAGRERELMDVRAGVRGGGGRGMHLTGANSPAPATLCAPGEGGREGTAASAPAPACGISMSRCFALCDPHPYPLIYMHATTWHVVTQTVHADN